MNDSSYVQKMEVGLRRNGMYPMAVLLLTSIIKYPSVKNRWGKPYKISRTFYLTYQDRISETVFRKFAVEKSETVFRIFEETLPFTLPWSHYLLLMRIKDENERKFYEEEEMP